MIISVDNKYNQDNYQRIALCTTCLSLPRYSECEILFDHIGCGQDCFACKIYMSKSDRNY